MPEPQQPAIFGTAAIHLLLRFGTVTAMTTIGLKRQIETAAGVVRWVCTHPANRGDRRALARAVRFQLRGRLGLRTRVRLGDRSQVWAVLHNTASAKVAYASPPDWAEMLAWRGRLQDGDLFVDVGANAGTYSVWAADRGAEVISVEPGAEARALLEENVRLNPHARVTVIDCALGARAGVMSFTEGRDAMNHLLPEVKGGLQVQVRTLDDILGSRTAAGVKVDVEGAERLVLEGAESALREGRIGVLQLEWNEMSQEVLGEDRRPVAAILERHGYELYRPDESGVLRPIASTEFGDDVFAVLTR